MANLQSYRRKVRASLMTLKSLFRNFFQQKVGISFFVIFIVFVLGLVFGVINSNPILWPLVYPLF